MKDFVQISRYAGMREDLVQAGGGNSAYKMDGERMAIKASGVQLADVSCDSGYALVNPKLIREAFLQREDTDSMTEEDSKRILESAFIEGARPSIETFLHSISGKYSLHTHPVVVNALTCRKDGADILKDMFPEALLVPYATPGVELAKAYFKEFKKFNREVKVVFLQNHGLLVSADSAREVIDMTEEITLEIEKFLKVDFSPYRAVTELSGYFKDGIVWRVTDSHVLQAEEKLGKTWDSAFCPDCIVFLGKKMFAAPDDGDMEKWEAFRKKNGEPVVISYKNGLYIHAESVKKALEAQSVLSFAAQVMSLNSGYACNMLSDGEKDFLLGWDAEKYRRNMK